ncbi:surface lipoprotein assembly modifier [Bergeriella denitrificans]|uniref:Protein of uncharacterized function (DUF560) n=1 Tax=Bergeriella denitrificans TaxID=494 RepID=A0A378UHF2_BERDE|nr:surface lipoprotein assembly modifier [Bergeriella denitrificans]STZ76735.1 Protein of uncharacterised function (DUF560) [Bergeriella denitrificans]
MACLPEQNQDTVLARYTQAVLAQADRDDKAAVRQLRELVAEHPEYFTRLSVSHPKLSWKGLTPRVNWTWTRVGSNHFYYRFAEHKVFIDISKQF